MEGVKTSKLFKHKSGWIVRIFSLLEVDIFKVYKLRFEGSGDEETKRFENFSKFLKIEVASVRWMVTTSV